MTQQQELKAILERLWGTGGDAPWDGYEKLYDAFARQYESDGDTVKELARLASEYVDSNPVVRGIIDYVMTALCGWSLATLIRVAGGEDIESATEKAPHFVWPSECNATLHPDAISGRGGAHEST
jgi:hypothetical protein